MMNHATLELSDGTTTIRLLLATKRRPNELALSDWKPAVQTYKNEGSWSDSPIADGRVPVFGRRGNIVDTFTFTATAANADKLARQLQDLLRLIEKANEYWLNSYSLEPVWLKAQATCESEPRYALVYRAAIPELGHPYASEFVSFTGTARMRNLSLVVEHGPWLSNPPLDPQCVQVSSWQLCGYPEYWNAEGRYADCGSDAGLDDLALGTFTFEGWFCPNLDDFGEYLGTVATLAAKSGPTDTVGWRVRISQSVGLEARICCATTNAYSLSGADEFPNDGQWHHIAMTYDNAGDRKIYLYVDGVPVASYVTQTAGVGAIVSDAAVNLWLADQESGGFNFHGKVGWVRISNNVRYAGAFAAPARCSIPAYDANTLACWGGDGRGPLLYAHIGASGRDATITESGTPPLGIWGYDCGCSRGHAADCSNEHYVTTGWSYENITHIYHYDASAGTWSTNLIGSALPYALLPAAPDAGDFVVFGIEGGGTFGSLVFDLIVDTSISTKPQITWEEHQGAINANTWNAIATYLDSTDKDTNPLNTAGVNAMSWMHGINWTTGDLYQIYGGSAPRIQARWVRARVVSWPITKDPPQQQNRDVYRVNVPYVDITADQVPGDIPFDQRIKAIQDYGTYASLLGFGEVAVGLRSYDRDEDNFQPIINLADFGNLPWVNVTIPGAPLSFAYVRPAMVGRAVQYAVAGAGTATVTVTINADMAQYFTGTFRVFLRYNCDLTPELARLCITSPYTATMPYVQLSAADWSLADLGTITIPSRTQFAADITLQLQITATAAGAGTTYTLYDLILLPVDEFAIRFRIQDYLSPDSGGRLIVDDITYPRDGLLCWSGNYVGDAFLQPGTFVSQQPPILQANRRQRLHFVLGYPGPPVMSDPAHVARIQIDGLARYLGLRGNR